MVGQGVQLPGELEQPVPKLPWTLKLAKALNRNRWPLDHVDRKEFQRSSKSTGAKNRSPSLSSPCPWQADISND